MRIHLKQPDIVRALQNYLATEYGVPLGSKSFEVEFTAGRKGSGLSAVLIVGESPDPVAAAPVQTAAVACTPAVTPTVTPVVTLEFPAGQLAQVVEEAIEAHQSPALAALAAAPEATAPATPVKTKRIEPKKVEPAPLVFEPAQVADPDAEVVPPPVKAKPGFNSLFS